jgi:death on curing protein
VTEPRWFTYEEAIVAYGLQLRRFGGAPGLRDEGLLRSALERPRNKWHYEGSELPELAASYAFGLIKNHAFVDGNKRIAFINMVAFLRLNGIAFKPDQAQSTAIILAVAAGEVSEQSLARWIRDNWPREERR